jgi:hypothetical protein
MLKIGYAARIMGEVIPFPEQGHRPESCPVCMSLQPEPLYYGVCEGCGKDIWLVWDSANPPHHAEPHFRCDGKGNVELE